ncbi:MAG: type IV pilus biogenesis protein PilM, partial [Planctomycetota bacterium]
MILEKKNITSIIDTLKKACCIKKQTALGIDISNEGIHLALVKKNQNGISILKTASGPVPSGAVIDGNIEDAHLLAKAIKKIKAGSRIGSHASAISMVAKPFLMQILELPKNKFNNAREFIRDEVKHYAQLPTHNAVIDYCGIKNSDGTGQRRALVVAVEQNKINEASKILNQKGLRIDAIEPACLAYIRECFAKKIAARYDTNLLFAVIHNNTVTLSLFRNQVLDFVRNKQIDIESLENGKFSECLAKEIQEITQFYEIEVSGKCEDWQVTVVAENFEDNDHVLSKSLNKNVQRVTLDVCSYQDTQNETELWLQEQDNNASPVAVGLAMKLLACNDSGLNINLLPKEISEAKTTEKHT